MTTPTLPDRVRARMERAADDEAARRFEFDREDGPRIDSYNFDRDSGDTL